MTQEKKKKRRGSADSGDVVALADSVLSRGSSPQPVSPNPWLSMLGFCRTLGLPLKPTSTSRKTESSRAQGWIYEGTLGIVCVRRVVIVADLNRDAWCRRWADARDVNPVEDPNIYYGSHTEAKYISIMSFGKPDRGETQLPQSDSRVTPVISNGHGSCDLSRVVRFHGVVSPTVVPAGSESHG